MGSVRPGDKNSLIDECCQEAFEVEEGPTSQTLKWIKGDIPWVLLEPDCFISCPEAGQLVLGPSNVVEVNATNSFNHQANRNS